MNKNDIDTKIMKIKNKISQTKILNTITEDKTPTKIISYKNIFKKNCNEDINIINNKYN